MYSENDFRLYHSWGKKPEQKEAEKKYNHEYYLKFKERILAKRRERQNKHLININNEEARRRNEEARNKALLKFDTVKVVSSINKAKDIVNNPGYYAKSVTGIGLKEDVERTKRIAEADPTKQSKVDLYNKTVNRYNNSVLGKVENGVRSFNEFLSKLRHSDDLDDDNLMHSWGKDPDDKAKEKKYNHEYWEEHKEEIMEKRRDREGYDESKKAHDAARKANGEKDYEGKEITDEASMDERLKEELEYIQKLIEANGGYSEGDMANITKHNEYIMANLTDLVKQAKADASGMDAEQKAELFKKINEQMNKAHELILDTSSKTSQDYLSNIGIKGSGTSKSSGGGSSSKSTSNSSDSSEEKKETSEEKTSSGGSKRSTPEENRYNFERQRAVSEIEKDIRRGNSAALESDEAFEKAARAKGFNTEDSEEYRRMRRMMRSENR